MIREESVDMQEARYFFWYSSRLTAFADAEDEDDACVLRKMSRASNASVEDMTFTRIVGGPFSSAAVSV